MNLCSNPWSIVKDGSSVLEKVFEFWVAEEALVVIFNIFQWLPLLVRKRRQEFVGVIWGINIVFGCRLNDAGDVAKLVAGASLGEGDLFELFLDNVDCGSGWSDDCWGHFDGVNVN